MLIIGITGGTASGKTTLVNQIAKELPKDDICIISQDSYYKDTTHLSLKQRVDINFDHPKALDFDLLQQHIVALKAGQTIQQPEYCFVKHNRTKNTKTITPKKVLIIEGILTLTPPELRVLFDIKVFVDVDSDERLIRRLKRDIAERGRDLNEVLTRYQNTLKPMHQQFIEPTKTYADIIIPNNTQNTVGITMITSLIKEKLQ